MVLAVAENLDDLSLDRSLKSNCCEAQGDHWKQVSSFQQEKATSSVGMALGDCDLLPCPSWGPVAPRTFHQSFALVQALCFMLITDHHHWLLHLWGRWAQGSDETLDPLITATGMPLPHKTSNSKTWETRPSLQPATDTTDMESVKICNNVQNHKCICASTSFVPPFHLILTSLLVPSHKISFVLGQVYTE